MRPWSAVSAVLCGAVLLAAVAGCAADGASESDGTVRVAASFYPLQYVAERVGGSHATVGSLTAPGVEPHDLELTPRQVAEVADADLVVYLAGFQPSVDSAVASESHGTAFDVTPYADLTLSKPSEDGGSAEGGRSGEEGQSGGKDPHFWLDPLRLAAVGDTLADRLATVDVPHAQNYRDNAAALRSDLEGLDEQFHAGTTTCDSRDLVVSHAAFGYLGEAYDFLQIAITGLSPEQEPSAADLAAISDLVRDNGVRTIYYEPLVPPDLARTVAEETGAVVAVLDPIEGVTDASAGDDYVTIMQANLASLRSGEALR